jgi:ubiquinone/menaquinone biosynthesis C-methylase UbiE
VTLAVALYLSLQVRKPTKWIGRFYARLMNATHSGLTDWGLSHVQIEKQFKVLDVGCGGGRTIRKLAAAATEGKVCGIDYAAGSVATARGTNAQLIDSGRVEIHHASVSQLPFSNDTFDVVTAVETQYYWPDLLADMKEIWRVLKPGGRLIIIAESYKGGRTEMLQRPVMWMLRSRVLSLDEQHKLFSAAGYTNVQLFEERAKGWICVHGEKPPAVTKKHKAAIKSTQMNVDFSNLEA